MDGVGVEPTSYHRLRKASRNGNFQGSFDGSFLLVIFSTGLFLTLVVLLSLRIRRAERETMFRLGCGRLTIFWLQVAELGILITLAATLAFALSLAVSPIASRILGLG